MKKSSPDLDKRLSDYYENATLPPDLLGDLGDIVSASQHPTPPVWHSWQRSAAVMAAFLVCVMLTVWGMRSYASQQQLELVAAEIALNHARRFDTEFSATSIAALTTEMDQLDFAPVHPTRMQFTSYDMVGARYCTVDDSIAVQIHLEDETNQAYTLYEFRNAIDVAPGQSHDFTFDNIQVTLWQEGEIVMGLAQRQQ